MEKGANPLHKSEKGETLLELTSKSGSKEISKLLDNYIQKIENKNRALEEKKPIQRKRSMLSNNIDTSMQQIPKKREENKKGLLEMLECNPNSKGVHRNSRHQFDFKDQDEFSKSYENFEIAKEESTRRGARSNAEKTKK